MTHDDWDRQYAAVERNYADLLAFQTPRYKEQGVCGPHCDSLVLHAPGDCTTCDEYASEIQAFRLQQRIAFTGRPAPLLETRWRPCPATLLRSVEQIEQWHGNVPVTPEVEAAREAYYRTLGALLTQDREEA